MLINILLNEYNKKKFEQICYKLWAWEVVFLFEYHFHMLMNILLNHYMLICNEDWCAAEISDFFIFKFKKKKFIYCIFLIFIIWADKQNQHDQLKIINTLQHKKFLICIFNNLIFYFFFHWNLDDEIFSNLNK